ncbi:MAG: cytochrome c-type biogenesis protein CcmH [Alphaproteobacteria bacterium]
MRILLAVVWIWCLSCGTAPALDPGERLADAALEMRAREIGKELRCLVCQNQSIDDSDADLARDLRRIVRQRLSSGDSDQSVLRYLVERYGDYVLLRPPVNVRTYALWYGPPLLFALALVVVFSYYRRAGSVVEPERPLSASEAAEVEQLIREHSEK